MGGCPGRLAEMGAGGAVMPLVGRRGGSQRWEGPSETSPGGRVRPARGGGGGLARSPGLQSAWPCLCSGLFWTLSAVFPHQPPPPPGPNLSHFTSLHPSPRPHPAPASGWKCVWLTAEPPTHRLRAVPSLGQLSPSPGRAVSLGHSAMSDCSCHTLGPVADAGDTRGPQEVLAVSSRCWESRTPTKHGSISLKSSMLPGERRPPATP